MAEDKFEKTVIEKLKQEGWTYRQDLSGVTADKLYQHWREILNRNNKIKLDGVPLSDAEFDLLILELNKQQSTYDAQLVLAGAGGIGTLPLTRDDGSQLEIEIFYGDEVAGGHSEYEVVNQITFNDLPNSLSANRRIDIMLLISGIPVAHIEEKDESLQDQWSAFNQFIKYASDGMYQGLFSFVQVQFILSQNSAHYFARPKDSTSYNRDFVFGWRDDNGQDVTDTMEFIHQVLGIPALHRLVTVNMIPDESNNNVMVMRSYQIQATRAILGRMKQMDENGLIEREGGYIWHTTGSGKTVTSFKVAQLLASMPRVRNVLFIVDRVDLVNQTFENFKSFSYIQFRNRIEAVNGHSLKRKLRAKNGMSQILLITVQGLDRAVKSGLKSDDRMVILMDEAHRSASGDSVARIKKELPNTTWFGFTGTPNFYSDEVNSVKTKKDISTFDIFGKRLHRYTIKDAIGDGNVLGFDVTYYTQKIEKDKSHNAVQYTDDQLEKEVYSSDPFRASVVADIQENWDDNASGPIEAGIRKPNQFQAILAVSGKQAVVSYYNLFREKFPQLRVAMTYSRNEDNGFGTTDLQDSLKNAMRTYSAMFNTSNFLEHPNPERDYLNDITKRLARKKPYNRGLDEDRLDLVIVADQLLTGFDSKYVNVIYMDKILNEGLLIQAMSRTNRTINRNAKPYGKVRFYRKGELMEENVKNALVIYTKGGNDTIEDAKKKPSHTEETELLNDDILAPRLTKQIDDINPSLARLKEIAGENFERIPKSEKAQLEFVELASSINSKVQRLIQQGYNFGKDLQVVDESGNSTGRTSRLDLDSRAHFGALQARLNDVNELLPPEKRIDLTKIRVAIQTYSSEIIDYDHLVELLNKYMDKQNDENRDSIEKHIAPMDKKGQDEIHEVIHGIDDGRYKVHFDTESLKATRLSIRTDMQELVIRRWAADNNYNGNDIVSAFDLYLPNVALNNNPQLNARVQEIEQAADIGFFETADFETQLMNFFESIK